uniref:Gomesin-like peptide n=1 Tax=Hadronyche infensa TaxID=153481 RepID=GOML_HADIN
MNRTRALVCLFLAVLILAHESEAQCRRLCYRNRCVTYCRGRGKRSVEEPSGGAQVVEKRAVDDADIPSAVEERELDEEESIEFR